MRGVSEFTIALLDLLTVEARAARRGLVEAALGVGLGLAGAVLATAAFVLALWGLFDLLGAHVSRPSAALLTAAATLAVAGLCIWLARRIAR